MPPKISVLIPTYNYARYLPEAIESVRAQTFRDFELIIVDDRSPDNTAEVVSKYCKDDPRIHFQVNPTNRGMVENWNHCLSLARGEYVKFLFGDDKLMQPETLAKMVAMLDEHRSATLAVSARTILDENSRPTDCWCSFSNGIFNGCKTITRCLLQNQNLIGEPSAVMFRRADAQRGFDSAFRQIVDEEMWFHLLERGDMIFTREPLCAFRRHAAQQTEVNNAVFSIREQLLLAYIYAAKPWVSRQQRADILYRARRCLRRDPDSRPQFFELEERLGTKSYFLTALKYRLRRPAENLVHSWKKRTSHWKQRNVRS